MLSELLNSRPGTHSKLPSTTLEVEDAKVPGVNFTMFLTMMGEHLFEFDTEADLIEAFESFDENDTGMVKCSEFRKWLAESGDKMDDREVSFDLPVLPPYLTVP
jgi:myosin regulatory light chain 12